MRLQKNIWLLAFCLVQYWTFSQQTTFLKNVGHYCSNYWDRWKATSDGGVVTVRFRDDSGFDAYGCPINNFQNKNYLSRYDKNGICLWEIVSPSTPTWNTAPILRYDFDLNPAGEIICSSNYGIEKYSATGNLLKFIPVTGQGYTLRVRSDQLGNTFLLVRIFDSLMIGSFKQLGNSNTVPYYLLKLNPSDQVLWCKPLPITYFTNLNDFTVDNENCCIFQTIFQNQLILYGDTIEKGSGLAVVKLNPNGNYLWSRKLAGIVWPNYFTTDANSNVYLASSFAGSMTIASSTLTENKPGCYDCSDQFICKLDKLGNLVWIKQITSDISTTEDFGGFDVSPSGFCYWAGDFRFTKYIGADSIPKNYSQYPSPDSYYARLDLNGNLNWFTIGRRFWPRIVCAAPEGGVYFHGNFQYFRMGTDSLNSCNDYDTYLLRKKFSGENVGIIEYNKTSNISFYPNPAHDKVILVSEIFVQRYIIINSNGQQISQGFIGDNRTIPLDFPPGVYLIKLLSGTDQIIKKLIIN